MDLVVETMAIASTFVKSMLATPFNPRRDQRFVIGDVLTPKSTLNPFFVTVSRMALARHRSRREKRW